MIFYFNGDKHKGDCTDRISMKQNLTDLISYIEEYMTFAEKDVAV